MTEALQLLGPMIAAILTVPVLGWIKSWLAILDRAPAWVQQLAGLGTAFGLTLLGQTINAKLPMELALFSGADLEALVAAAMAFGIHAGKKARQPLGPGSAALLFALLLPVGAFAQVGPGGATAPGTDSVVVTVVDRSGYSAVITTDTMRLRGAPGDTVTFEAVVLDNNSGDTIPSLIRWTSNSGVVDINAATGFATFLGGCGVAICRATIFADVDEIVGFRIYSSYPDGVWRELEAHGDNVGTTAAIPYVLPAPECMLWDMATGVRGPLGGWAVVPDCTLEAEPTTDQLCAYISSGSGLWYRSGEECPSRPWGVGAGQPFPLPIDPRAGALIG